jgi:predicted O-methyltransferase YrrM
MTNYTFTCDFVSHAVDVWKQIATRMLERKSFLEIGSYEGRSAIWFAENILDNNGNLFCVDNWLDNEEAEHRFDENIKKLRASKPEINVIKCKANSSDCLAQFIIDKKTFDLIYIDASHEAQDVLLDACLSWKLTKHNSVIIFDDYLLGGYTAKIAIDIFTNIYQSKIKYLHIGHQLIIQRTN